MTAKKILLGLLILGTLTIVGNEASAQTKYPGRKHTTSHGGKYTNGKGSSHKGGKYKNPKTSNRYGRHKR